MAGAIGQKCERGCEREEAELDAYRSASKTRRAHEFGVVGVGRDGRTVEAFLEKPADPPGIPGLPVATVCASSLSAQAWTIQKLLNRFVIEENVRGEDLALLVVDGPNKDTHYGALRDRPEGCEPLPDSAQRKIMGENAARCYGLT